MDQLDAKKDKLLLEEQPQVAQQQLTSRDVMFLDGLNAVMLSLPLTTPTSMAVYDIMDYLTSEIEYLIKDKDQI